MHFVEGGGGFQLALLVFAAFGLDLAEQNESAFELAGEALAVNTDVGESPIVFTEGQGHSEGGFGLRMVGADTIFHFGDPDREEVGLDGGGAVELPGGVDQGQD